MPIYEYECENMHRFEKWQSMKDDALTECPECGKPVRKIFHPAGIIFKGSGWYITDSRKSSGASDSSESKREGGGDTKSETKSEPKESKSEGGSEAKSETKTEAKDSKSSSGDSKTDK